MNPDLIDFVNLCNNNPHRDLLWCSVVFFLRTTLHSEDGFLFRIEGFCAISAGIGPS